MLAGVLPSPSRRASAAFATDRARSSPRAEDHHAVLSDVAADAWDALRAGDDDDDDAPEVVPADVTEVVAAAAGSSSVGSSVPSRPSDPSDPSDPSRFVPGDGSGGEMSDAAVLVVAYNRADYLAETLASLADVADLDLVTVYVSPDGDDGAVARVASPRSTVARRLQPPATRGYEHWKRPRVPQLGYGQPGHAWLAQHYKWAIDRAFEAGRGSTGGSHSHVIIVEDDMRLSPDFVSYFRRTAVLLERDPTLWCVSSWNDNGAASRASDPLRLRRTGYFPGLGWMMRRELWVDELSAAWPKEHWDHWMRLDATSRSRECVVPEVNRNFNIGEVGANMRRDTYAKYLARMSFNARDAGDFGDLGGLLKDAWDAEVEATVRGAAEWPWRERTGESPEAWARRTGVEPGRAILAAYKQEEYEALAALVDAWPSPRAHSSMVAMLPSRRASEGGGGEGGGEGEDGSREDASPRTIALADARFCPFLPEVLRERPSAGLRATPARRNQDCDAACAASNLRCVAKDFWFLNRCAILEEHFACENGCAPVLGDDVPNYVVARDADTFGKCLVTERRSTCRASHRATRRLCACAP